MKRAFKYILVGINQLFWPAICESCSENIDEQNDGLCNNCWGMLLSSTASHFCPRCGRNTSPYSIVNNSCPECINEKYYFDSIARVGVYSDTLRNIILKYKSGSTHLNTRLSKLLDSALEGSNFKSQIDIFLPVPLHWRKRLKRGYNQSALLAKHLMHPANINHDLVRIKNTVPQSTLNRTKRRKNVAGAFAIRKNHSFKGKKICLIDDIKTTGATLNECASVLKQAGVDKVFALVIAVAGDQKK